MFDISVVVLNWNNWQETCACVQSLLNSTGVHYQVIVVDNGSQDGSQKIIRNQFPEINLICNDKNLGYAEGNNVGIRAAISAGSRYIFVLNNDTRVASDSLAILCAAGDKNPDCAFLGPKILHLDQPDQVQSRGIQLDYLWRSSQRGLDTNNLVSESGDEIVECISGAAIFARADALAGIGLLDPDYFLYREDIDWCLRVRKKGYKILFVPGAVIWHRSHHVRENDLPRVTYYMTRNSLLLYKKQNGGPIRFTLLLIRFLGTIFSWSIRPKWRNKQSEKQAMIVAIKDYFKGRFGKGDV